MSAFSRRSLLTAAAATPALLSTAGAAENVKPVSKFKLGLVSYNVSATWDLKTTLDICKRVGIAAVECRTTHKHGLEPSLDAEARKNVKKQFADAGIVFWGCGSICEFHSAESSVVEKNVETCKQFVKLVADLGGKGVKVRPNGVAKGSTPEKACEQIGKALIECGKAASDAGVEIWVEVHGSVTQLPKNMKAIMDFCGHPSVGVTWNSNATDLANGSIAEGFELLKSHIKSCHINNLENDANGKYPYRDLFKRLAGIGYDRYTLIEVGNTFEPGNGEAYLRLYKAMWNELTKAA